MLSASVCAKIARNKRWGAKLRPHLGRALRNLATVNPVHIHLDCIRMALLIQYTRLPLQSSPPCFNFRLKVNAKYIIIYYCMIINIKYENKCANTFSNLESVLDFFRPTPGTAFPHRSFRWWINNLVAPCLVCVAHVVKEASKLLSSQKEESSLEAVKSHCCPRQISFSPKKKTFWGCKQARRRLRDNPASPVQPPRAVTSL